MRSLLALSLMMVVAVQVSALEKKAKKAGGGMNPQVQKMTEALNSVGLTEEQSAKLAAATEAYQGEMKTLRDEGLTPELTKKRAEAGKAAREAGLKGKEMQAKISESMTEAELALVSKADAAMATLKKAVAGMLTEDQMAKLPEEMKKQLTVKEPKKAKNNA